MQWHNTALDRRSRLCCSTGRVLCNTVEKCNEEAVATWPGERLKRRRVSELRWWGWCNVWELWIGFYYPQWQIFFSYIHTLRVWLKDTLTQMPQLVTDQLSCSCDKKPHKTTISRIWTLLSICLCHFDSIRLSAAMLIFTKSMTIKHFTQVILPHSLYAFMSFCHHSVSQITDTESYEKESFHRTLHRRMKTLFASQCPFVV